MKFRITIVLLALFGASGCERMQDRVARHISVCQAYGMPPSAMSQCVMMLDEGERHPKAQLGLAMAVHGAINTQTYAPARPTY